MISRIAAIDGAIAVTAAALVLIVSPGWAVTAIVALVVLVVCGVAYAWSARRRRRVSRGHHPKGPRKRAHKTP